jgi:hypothetical protein
LLDALLFVVFAVEGDGDADAGVVLYTGALGGFVVAVVARGWAGLFVCAALDD